VELKTAITSGKKRTGLQESQEDPRAGIREASEQNVQRDSENVKMDLVKRSTPRIEKKIVHGVGAENV
jgi:hypothetical protein